MPGFHLKIGKLGTKQCESRNHILLGFKVEASDISLADLAIGKTHKPVYSMEVTPKIRTAYKHYGHTK